MLWIAALLLVVVGGFAAAVIFAVKLVTGARKAIDAVAADVSRGAIAGMIQWQPAMLAALSSDWVGATHYVRGGFGNRDAAAGKLYVAGSRSIALAFVCESEMQGSRGRMELITSALRLFGVVDPGAVWISSATGPLGAFVIGNGALLDATGQPIGHYLRGGAELYVPAVLYGRCIGSIHARGNSHAKLPANMQPLFAGLDVRAAYEESWLLALAVLELGHFGVLRNHGRMGGGGASLGV